MALWLPFFQRQKRRRRTKKEWSTSLGSSSADLKTIVVLFFLWVKHAFGRLHTGVWGKTLNACWVTLKLHKRAGFNRTPFCRRFELEDTGNKKVSSVEKRAKGCKRATLSFEEAVEFYNWKHLARSTQQRNFSTLKKLVFWDFAHFRGNFHNFGAVTTQG